MQRKAYVPGVAALLAALMAGCTGGSSDGTEDDAKPGETATTATAAQPGKYRTLPEPCGAVSHGTLDSLLPGIKQMTDEEQREKAYEGTATVTYDTDRKVGCRWKAESVTATDHLLVDFERVVSYDNTVSDDDRATEIYVKKEEAADLPEPVASPSDSPDASESSDGPESSGAPDSGSSPSGSKNADSSSGSGATPSTPGPGKSGASDDASGDAGSSANPSGSGAPGSTPVALQPRTLDDLGNAAFLDDALNDSKRRTVTVVFRTSNVVVTIQYDEQPATTTDVPSSEEMQDRARKLAGQLAGTFND